MEVQTSICLRYFETTMIVMIVTVHHQFINMKIFLNSCPFIEGVHPWSQWSGFWITAIGPAWVFPAQHPPAGGNVQDLDRKVAKCVWWKRDPMRKDCCGVFIWDHMGIYVYVYMLVSMSIMLSNVDYNLLEYSHCLISFWGCQLKKRKTVPKSIYWSYPRISCGQKLPDHVFGCFCSCPIVT